ncbi:MAG: LamG-like jellyroll fold domain-containing protein [Anaerohalosphaeraceae bacterium]
MKNVLYILICLGAASTGWALSITNGDFEAQFRLSRAADVAGWYDFDNSGNYSAGPWYERSSSAGINATGCLFLPGAAATGTEDGGRRVYVYQSIGLYDGTPSVELSLDWGAAGDRDGGLMGLTVMIFESDGTFKPGEWYAFQDIYGAAGVREITRATVVRNLVPGQSVRAVFTLDLSAAVVGRELFLRLNNYNAGVAPWICIDNITLTVSKIARQSPKNKARFIPVERTSAANDLVFTILDPAVTAVDVYFGPEKDPNLFQNPAFKIVSSKPVSTGLYSITLETEWPSNLLNDTDYYWCVVPVNTEPNGIQPWTFRTVMTGPYLDPVSPANHTVNAGADVVFTVLGANVDAYQWYKEGVGALSNGAVYQGVNTNTLTIRGVQIEQEGAYYCIGTQTSTGQTAQSLSSGELIIKRLKHYFPFEQAENGLTADVVGDVQAQLMGGASVSGADENSIVGGYLVLSNPGSDAEDTQYVNILDPAVFDNRQLTVSAWFRMSTLDRKAGVWDCGSDDNNNWSFYPYYQQDQSAYGGLDVARSEFRVGSNLRTLDGGYEMNADQWYFVTMTVDQNGTGKLYIDGKYLGVNDLYPPLNLPKTAAYIGRRVTTTTQPMFNGFIDELKIYNYVRSSAEIAQDYMAVRTDVNSICNEEIYDLAPFDYDRNCRVDLADLAQIALKWLKDFRIYAD